MKSGPITVAALFLVSFVSEATEWKVGLARVVITPEEPVVMAGYASRTEPFKDVEHDLYAKALAIEDVQGNRAVLVTTDLIGIPRAIGEPVCERIGERTGLTRKQILLSASHTHAGPLPSLEDRTRYDNVSSEHGQRNVAYTRQLQRQLAEVAELAVARLEPATLAWSSGIAHFVMNRREFTADGVRLGVNPRGLVDRTVPVLRIASPEGKVRAVLFGYACHNTTLTGSNFSICGDYAGFAQLHVEKEHPGSQAMFMSGCGGDANPHPRGTMEAARAHGAALGGEVGRVLEGDLHAIEGSLTCAFAEAALPLQRFSREELESMAAKGPSWSRANAQAMVSALDRQESLPTSYDCPTAVWQFGQDLTLVALSGEVVVDYVPLIENAIGPLNTWIAAYCNDVFGYLPSARVLGEGGYECRGLYTTHGFFDPEAQEVLVHTVRELARTAGR